jgi:DNA-directed RNA polymerase specialized sigma24 family protein
MERRGSWSWRTETGDEGNVQSQIVYQLIPNIGPELPSGHKASASGPPPEEAANLAELIEKSLAGLASADAEVFLMRLEGHIAEEIAARFCCTRSMIRTKLGRVQRRLEVLLEETAQS